MKLKNNEIIKRYRETDVSIVRNSAGIPEINSSDLEGLMYGLGWVHAHDRQLQALMTRIIITGRTAEVIAGKDELIKLDKYMRMMNFLPVNEEESLEPDAGKRIQAYCDGFNASLKENGTVWEFRLLGYTPEPWTVRDCILVGKVLGFFGQTDSQGAVEKLIIQLIRNDIDGKKIKELFPVIKEKIDYDLIKKIRLSDPVVPDIVKWISGSMRGTGSNNWAVSGKRTASGSSIMCSDPHLEVNRLPSVFYEVVLKMPDNYFIGVAVPGMPGLTTGRSRFVSWGPTFAYIDMLDYKIEHCRDGSYQRGRKWIPFHVREEIIRVKKGKPLVQRYYENGNGVIEGEISDEGNYLCMTWAARKGTGADLLNCAMSMDKFKTVNECIKGFRKVEAISINWVFADSSGNIGYQMSGRQFNRPRGVSGMLPTPAWDTRYDYKGYISSDRLPSCYNPAEGFIVSANNNLNHLGRSNPINLCIASYRYDRIRDLLKSQKKSDLNGMKSIQYDLYSLHAEKFMKIFRPFITDSENGRILKEWDLKYTSDSKGAMLFESVYRSLVKIVFGDNGIGRDAVEYLMKETIVFSEYSGNFDSVLLSEKSSWFGGKKRDELYNRAVEEGLNVKAENYGKKNSVMMKHLLFGGLLPRFMGFDYGPVEINGASGTVSQGNVFRYAGRDSSFCPSYRMVTDMGTDEVHTNLPGGPSDRRFSKWYTTDIVNWLKGNYKILKGI
jgi:penicillin amidase